MKERRRFYKTIADTVSLSADCELAAAMGLLAVNTYTNGLIVVVTLCGASPPQKSLRAVEWLKLWSTC